MADKIFVPGFRTFAKREGAPDFVLGTLIITLEDFGTFVNGEGKQYLTDYEGKKQLKLNLTMGKNDNVVIAVDTYKKDDGLEGGITPSEETKERVRNAIKQREEAGSDRNTEMPPDDLPW